MKVIAESIAAMMLLMGCTTSINISCADNGAKDTIEEKTNSYKYSID